MLDIGKELKDLRLKKGLSLQEIAELTKINIIYLEYLEQNNFNFLPEVYVRAFLKNYIKALETDEKKFLSALDELLHPTEIETTESKEPAEKILNEVFNEKEFPAKKFTIGKTNIITIRNVSFLVGAILILTILIILIFKQDENKIDQATQNASEKMYEEIPEIDENFNNIASGDTLVLGVKAKDSVWVQVKMDGVKIEEVYLRTGDLKKFKAKNDFQLLVGNAGGIILYLNETELPFTGVKGSVRRLKIDKNGVELIQVKNEPHKQ